MAEKKSPQIFELNNGSMKVLVSNYGCTITSLFVPDKHGKLDDVVLGFDTLDPYLLYSVHMCRIRAIQKGSRPGISGLAMSSRLGGIKGFDKVVWEVIEHKKGDNPSITFKYHARDGEEGYPGDLTVTATYTLTANTSLRLDMEAVPENKPTPVSLAQHTYWNLAGHSSGTILDHSAQIYAKHFTPLDQTQIPTGEIKPVEGTPFDFTTEKKIGTSIHEVGIGYDHNYVLDCGEEKSGLKHAVKLKDPSSSRVLNLWTNAPGIQFYTANYVNGIVGKGGAVYEKHGALCLETQGFPNAINQTNFPSIVVQPGEKYQHSMVYEFSTD
ncbi:aldose 1-epimerase [Tanacetum coccineum]